MNISRPAIAKWLIIIFLIALFAGFISFTKGTNNPQIQTHTIIEEVTPTTSPLNTNATCNTTADCPDTCNEKLIAMYGNRSHCPIPSCDNGTCSWKLVP